MILDRIIAYKREKIAAEKELIPLAEIVDRVDPRAARDFKQSLKGRDRLSFIAEVKKVSPSKGMIKEDFDPLEIAAEYERNQVETISVLTEDKFFWGDNRYLTGIKLITSIPVLRKDFIIDRYQIYQSRLLGADAILLIAAVLSKEQLAGFQKIALEIGMQCLVEVHDEVELEMTLETGADIIGINNRNLQTFQTSLATTERLVRQIPRDKVIISESGIKSREDVEYLKSLGVDGLLVGEGLMRAKSITRKLQELRGKRLCQVKICGLKRAEDVLYVNELKPDYVGFVFVESSRRVDKLQAKELIKKLVSGIKKVGIFLNASLQEVREIAGYCGLDVLQFHGEETPRYCRSFKYEVWKAFRIKAQNSLDELERYHVDGILLDTYFAGQPGGTGKAFNWDIVSGVSKKYFTILAGGLSSENVWQAIQVVRPQVVDVSSGVETNEVKDFKKMKDFIKKVRG